MNSKKIDNTKHRGRQLWKLFGLFGMLTWVDQWYRPGKDLSLDLLAQQFSSIFLGEFVAADPAGTGASPSGESDPARHWSQESSASSILSGPGF